MVQTVTADLAGKATLIGQIAQHSMCTDQSAATLGKRHWSKALRDRFATKTLVPLRPTAFRSFRVRRVSNVQSRWRTQYSPQAPPRHANFNPSKTTLARSTSKTARSPINTS